MLPSVRDFPAISGTLLHGESNTVAKARSFPFLQDWRSHDRNFYKETDGALKSPDYPCENMPRSQLQTPVVSYILTIAYVRLLPSARLKVVGFPPTSRDYLMTTTIHISGLRDAACFLDSPSFVLPLLGLHVGFTTNLLVKL